MRGLKDLKKKKEEKDGKENVWCINSIIEYK